MLSFKQFVSEKRSNPDKNPRVSSYEQVKPYLKDGYYISMRDINKLGINPQSKYKTPNGIYSYHLGAYKDRIENQNSLIGLPYVSDAALVYVFKPKVKPIKLGDMTEESVKLFIKRVFIKKPELKIFFLEKVDYLKSLERKLHTLKKDKETEMKSKDDSEYLFDEMDVEILKVDYSSAFDVKPKTYTLDQYIKLMDDTIKKLEIELRDMKGDLNNPKFLVDKIYDQGKEEAQVKTPGGIFWWFSWFIYQLKVNKWNGFFREMGIYGVDDNKGESIIHPNEPFQTVFFDKTKLEVVKVFDNKDYTRLKKENREKEKGKIYVGEKTFEYELNQFGDRMYPVININNMNLKKIPKFGDNYVVGGSFRCSGNYLTTLEGAPKYVGGNFYCSDNKKQFTEEEVRDVSMVEGNVYV